MSTDAIDAKAPWDWCYLWIALRSDTVQAIRDYLADESTARARRIRRALSELRRVQWWAAIDQAQSDAGVTIGANYWELWHGPLDRDHVPWVAAHVPNCRIIRCWWPHGIEVGQSITAAGSMAGAPIYRELTATQENTLRSTWQSATGYTGPMWWPGRPCGTPEPYM